MLTLESDDEHKMYCYDDADFSVHANMKSHTGSVFYLEKGIIVAASTKHKVNAIILTESELIGVDDRVSKILWNQQFLECQGFKINRILFIKIT